MVAVPLTTSCLSLGVDTLSSPSKAAVPLTTNDSLSDTTVSLSGSPFPQTSAPSMVAAPVAVTRSFPPSSIVRVAPSETTRSPSTVRLSP